MYSPDIVLLGLFEEVFIGEGLLGGGVIGGRGYWWRPEGVIGGGGHWWRIIGGGGHWWMRGLLYNVQTHSVPHNVYSTFVS